MWLDNCEDQNVSHYSILQLMVVNEFHTSVNTLKSPKKTYQAQTRCKFSIPSRAVFRQVLYTSFNCFTVECMNTHPQNRVICIQQSHWSQLTSCNPIWTHAHLLRMCTHIEQTNMYFNLCVANTYYAMYGKCRSIHCFHIHVRTCAYTCPTIT